MGWEAWSADPIGMRTGRPSEPSGVNVMEREKPRKWKDVTTASGIMRSFNFDLDLHYSDRTQVTTNSGVSLDCVLISVMMTPFHSHFSARFSALLSSSSHSAHLLHLVVNLTDYNLANERARPSWTIITARRNACLPLPLRRGLFGIVVYRAIVTHLDLQVRIRVFRIRVLSLTLCSCVVAVGRAARSAASSGMVGGSARGGLLHVGDSGFIGPFLGPV